MPTFSNSYFLSKRFTSNGKQIFTPEDTNGFNCQSKNAKPYHISNLLIPNIQQIDTTGIKNQISNHSIAKKMKIPFTFSYIEMYTPLLNFKKNKAIIGVSEYTMTEYFYKGFGNFIIMEKQGEKWKKINEVDWWGY